MKAPIIVLNGEILFVTHISLAVPIAAPIRLTQAQIDAQNPELEMQIRQAVDRKLRGPRLSDEYARENAAYRALQEYNREHGDINSSISGASAQILHKEPIHETNENSSRNLYKKSKITENKEGIKNDSNSKR